jgi:hypothetical protein
MKLKMIDDIDLSQHHHMISNYGLFPLELQIMTMLGQQAINDHGDLNVLFLDLKTNVRMGRQLLG